MIREKWILNWISTTLEFEQAAQQVLVILDIQFIVNSIVKPKSVLLQKIDFFLRPARELIFSFQNSSLKMPTGKNHPSPGKNLCVEKNGLKVTKNRFFGSGVLTTFRKSQFRPWILELTTTKFTLPKTALKTACNDVLVLFVRRLW